MSSSNDTAKVPRLQTSKGFALWRLYVSELMRRDGVLHVLNDEPPDPVTSTVAQLRQWKKDDQKARPHIVLNLGEEPATLVTSLLISDASTKEVWKRLCDTYQRENIQSQLNLRTKLHNLQLTENGDIQAHLTQLEEIFVDLARINDPVAEADKTGVLLRSIPKSLSFIAVVVQANNMNYVDLCALLKSEDERRKSVKPSADVPPPPHPAARMSNSEDQRHDNSDRKNVTCWYCGKRGHMQGECRLRRRNDRDRSFKNNRNGRGGNSRQQHRRGRNDNYNRQGQQQQPYNRGNFNDQQQNDQQNRPRGFLTKLHAYTTSSSTDKSNRTWLDCGANDHFIWDRNVFQTYKSVSKHAVDTCAGIGTIYGEGRVDFKMNSTTVSLTCKHVPGFKENVISLSKLLPTYKVDFQYEDSFIGFSISERKTNTEVLRKESHDGLYPFPSPLIPITKALLAASLMDTATDWHKRLGHIGIERTITAMEKVDGIPKLDRTSLKNAQCIPCIQSKSKRAPLLQPIYRPTRPLELTHTDMTGRISVKSLGGAHFFVAFLGNYSAMSAVYFIQNKSQFMDCLRAYKALTENESGYRMYALRLDNAGEQKSNEFHQFISQHGMTSEFSPAYASQSNGASERLIQELWNMARTMLLDSRLSEELWGEAISHSNWLRNRLPSKRANFNIPITLWRNIRPDLSSVLAFGTKGYIFQYRPDAVKGKKFLPRTLFGQFVGMESQNTLYRAFVPSLNRVQICRKNDFTTIQKDTTLPSFETLTADISRQRQFEEIEQIDDDSTAEDTLHQCFFTHYSNQGMAYKAKVNDKRVPRSFNEACKIPSWAEAIDREYNALVERGTWKYIDETADLDPLPFTWNFRLKDVDDGTLCKARCCLCGNFQLEYRDFDPDHLYAPVVKHETIRMFITKAAGQKLKVEGADINNAYLFGDMDIPIVMRQPTDSSGKQRYPGKVCLLLKSIYGTRQAGEIWGSHFHKKLIEWNFQQSSQDQRLYFLVDGRRFLVLIIVVDDMAFASNEQSLIDEFKTNLTSTFKVKLLGKLTSFIGWQLRYTEEGIYLHQSKYIEKMLQEHNLSHIKPVTTPLPLSADLTSRLEDEPPLSKYDHDRYRSLIGSLSYLAICTRPDISFAVSSLSRQLHDPTQRHLTLAKRVVRYISDTREKSIFYPSNSHSDMKAYVDSDWAGCHETRRSTTGTIITINNSPIYWQSKHQSLIALSSAEAEYIAASHCAKNVVWLRKLYWEMTNHRAIEEEPQLAPTEVTTDSTGAISITTKPSVSERNKHIDLKCHHIKDLYERKIIWFKHTRTFNQPADMLTKPVSFPILKRLLSLISM